MGTGASKPPSHKINVITGEGSKDHFTYEQYSIYKDYELGSGTYGSVYKGYDTDKKRLIAAKQIRHASAEFSQTEVDVLKHLTEHDNIVRIYDTFMYNDSRYIIMQFCNGPCLDKYLPRKNPSLESRFDLIFQIIETFQYMHFAKPRTAHRDVKPSNIIVVHGSHVKLCDFGLAKFADTEKSFKVSTVAGTPSYMSPEIHKFIEYDPFKADVFAAGLVFLAIVTFVVGQKIDHVFQSAGGIGCEMVHNPDVLQRKLDGLEYACERTMALIWLIARMVKFKPEERPDFHEIFEIFMRDIGQGEAAGESRSDTTGRGDTPKDPTPGVPQAGARPKERPHQTAEKPGIRAKSRGKSGSSGDQKPGPSGDREPESSGYQRNFAIARVPRGVPHNIILRRLIRRTVNGSWWAGVSERGHVVLADNNGRHISLLSGPQCDVAARMELPDEVESDCRKAVDARGRVLVQAKAEADTLCLDRKGREIYRIKSSGELLTCMGGDILCYREYNITLWTDTYRIRLQRGGDGTPTYLEPPGRRDYGLSVCRNNDGTYCVTESLTRTLDFFTAAGDHIHHEDLPYQPIPLNAVAATSSGHVLIVGCDDAIHIHDASGRRVGAFTKQQIGVEEEDIFGISYSREDETLTVLAGNITSPIHSVLAFQLEYK